MYKYAALFAVATIVALVAPSTKPASTSGSWQVDTRHSDAKLMTDATTDYGKTKITVALGYARVNGKMTLDDSDPAKSSIDFRMYPATSMSPVMSSAIDEDGKFVDHWLSRMSNQTLVCFHSKTVTRKPDGKLQATGVLTLTRIDRNVIDSTPNEGYAGPVYGPPVMHRVSHEATFVFDAPAADAKGQKDGGILESGSTSMFREDFPQLMRAVVSTYWPPVVQEKECQARADVGEDYHGFQCTGTFLVPPALPDAPHAINAEDIGAQQSFNSVVGNRLTIQVHLHLTPKSSGEPVAGGY